MSALRAVVANLNQPNKRGEVLLPGAIVDGTVVKISRYDHCSYMRGRAPVGEGRVWLDGERVVCDVEYVDQPRGREALALVTRLGAACRWSIGCGPDFGLAPMTDEWRSRGAIRLLTWVDLWEVSPTRKPADPLTFTLGAL